MTEALFSSQISAFEFSSAIT